MEEFEKRIVKLEAGFGMLEKEVGQLHSSDADTSKKFEQHMAKEEKSFDNLYNVMRSLEQRVTDVVVKGMDGVSQLKDDFRKELEGVQKSTASEISSLKKDFLSKQTAVIAFTVGTAVAAIVIFLFSTFTVDKASEKQTEQFKDMINGLVVEIRKGK